MAARALDRRRITVQAKVFPLSARWSGPLARLHDGARVTDTRRAALGVHSHREIHPSVDKAGTAVADRPLTPHAASTEEQGTRADAIARRPATCSHDEGSSEFARRGPTLGRVTAVPRVHRPCGCETVRKRPQRHCAASREFEGVTRTTPRRDFVAGGAAVTVWIQVRSIARD
jgi:hypothetical protein